MTTILIAAVALSTQAQPVIQSVNAWVSRNVAPGKNIRLSLNTRNVPVVYVTAFPVDGQSWLSRTHNEAERPKPNGKAVKSWTLTVAQKQQYANPRDNYFSRQVNLPIQTPGVYLLHIAGGTKQTSVIVNVTNLAVVAKRSPYRSLVWVTDHKTGRVVKNAEVLFSTEHGGSVAQATTGQDGTAFLPVARTAKNLVIKKGKDLAGIQIGAMEPDGHLRALFQTDRPIYRPGQTLLYKAILRLTDGQGYKPFLNQDVLVQLRDPKDNPLEEVRVRPTALGSVSGQFTLPQEGLTGPYTLRLDAAGQIAYQTVTVAAYRKPEFKVEIAPNAKRFLSGEEIRFKVHASYYFGAALPQASIRWIARRSPSWYVPESDEDNVFYGGDGNLYPRDTYASTPFAADGEAFTDKDGNAEIVVKTDPKAPDSTYSLEATITDNSRRQIQGGSTAPVYASERRLGLTTSRTTVALGGLIPIDIRLADLDNQPRAGKVTLTAWHQVWIEKEGRWKRVDLTKITVNVPSNGRARANMPALAEGQETIEATTKDSTGREAIAEMGVYVAAPDYRPEKEDEQPFLNLRLDRRVYAPGDTTHAFVETNTRNRPILLVHEGRDIWEYRVVPKSSVWDIKATLKQSPNSYVSAAQWAGPQLMSANQILPVPDKSRKLSVEVTPDKTEYRPGDTATVRVRTKDNKGKSVSAEVALAVVDEAIYALSPDTTPNPYGFYWGLRANDVVAYESAPEELSGGAYQRASQTTAPVRQRFEDTAFWNPIVSTDANGEGQVTFEMPGNLTTWRTTARAITGDTRGGETRNKVLASRPLTLRFATPRSMAVGDTVGIIATLNNRTDKDRSVKVTVQAEGLKLEGEPTKSIDVPKHGEAKLTWNVHVDSVGDMGVAKLHGTAQDTEGEGDALLVSVPLVPRGVVHTSVFGGVFEKDTDTSLALPNDLLTGGTYVHLEVAGGLGAIARQKATQVIRGGRYGSPAAANILEAAVSIGPENVKNDVREALALLSRTQLGDGWGWWENSPTDPVISAQVLYTLALAREANITVFDSMWNAARYSIHRQYVAQGLWEWRALLAAALAFSGDDQGLDFIKEVRERGINVSPYAKLRMAEALAKRDQHDAALHVIESVLPLVSDSSTEAFVPVDSGIGWTANSVRTTAQLLSALTRTESSPDLQKRLARWLALRDSEGYEDPESKASVARALVSYVRRHPEGLRVGPVVATLGGKTLNLNVSSVADAASGDFYGLPLAASNPLHLSRTETGEVFWRASVRFYQPGATETRRGVRVMRRYEVRNEAGMWIELNRNVKPGEPVRCTVVVWGDDLDDAVKVTEPLPAGFEFVDSEYANGAREDVRDAAVIHYMVNAGSPTTFRYYLRAETDGHLAALPAVGEYIRRPAMEGHSAMEEITVSGG